MWSRYRSSARRPVAVSRYRVWGTRPANDLVQVTYCAPSSLRAWTLRFPSVVLRSVFSSLNVSASFTASALTMPRRTRSWIRRSSSAARAPERSLRAACATVSTLRAPPGTDGARVVPPARLHPRAPPADHEGPHRFPQPRREPQLHTWLPRREERGGERRRADRHLAPAGDGGERPRPLHGLADEAEIVDGAVAQGAG